MQIKVDEDLPKQVVALLRENGFHAGVMLLRPDQDGIRPMVELNEKILHSYDLNTLVRYTTVVTPRGVRVRKSV